MIMDKLNTSIRRVTFHKSVPGQGRLQHRKNIWTINTGRHGKNGAHPHRGIGIYRSAMRGWLPLFPWVRQQTDPLPLAHGECDPGRFLPAGFFSSSPKPVPKWSLGSELSAYRLSVGRPLPEGMWLTGQCLAPYIPFFCLEPINGR